MDLPEFEMIVLNDGRVRIGPFCWRDESDIELTISQCEKLIKALDDARVAAFNKLNPAR